MATSVGRRSGHSPANVTKNLKGIDFPAEKDDLLKQAKQLKAEQVVIDEIRKMPEREYNSMADVMKAFGEESKGAGPSSTSASRSGKQGQAGQGKSQGKSTHHR